MLLTNGSGSGFGSKFGSGSWILDPDPAILVIDLQHASKKLIFNTIFSAYNFLKEHLHNFSKIKSQKESQNIRNQGFSNYFYMMIEGSGSIPLTSGSGSWRPKNMWIRWIRLRSTDINSAVPYLVIYFGELKSKQTASTYFRLSCRRVGNPVLTNPDPAFSRGF
jgi:hypothetical protein